MNNQVLLHESATAPLVKRGKRWRVVLATPGQGSSGKYSPDVLRTDGPLAVPPGTKAFADHDTKRSIKDMIGFYPEGAVWNEEDQLLEAELQPFAHWQDVVDELGPFAEASIFVMGEKDKDGNVTRLVPHRSNTVDLVGFAGLNGSGLKEQVESLIEQARSIDNPNANPAEERKKETMLDQETRDAIKVAVTEALAPLLTSLNASADEVKAGLQAEADRTVIDAAVDAAMSEYAEKLTAIEAANLLAPQVESLKAAAKRGEDVAPLIEDAKRVVEAAKAVAAPATTVVGGYAVRVGETANTDTNFTVTGW